MFPLVNEGLRSLEDLDLRFCNLTDRGLPEDIGSLSSLKTLYLMGNNFEHLPRSIAQLGALQSLHLSFCKKLKELPCFTGMPNLDTLDLSECNLIDGAFPEGIGSLPSLKKLDLRGNNFEHLPQSIAQLGALEYLDLSNCKNLKELPCFTGMPNLEYLDLNFCKSLKEVHESLRYSRKLIRLTLIECTSLEQFPHVNVESLESLILCHCSSLEKFPEIHGRMKPELKITMKSYGLREIPSSIIHLLVADLTKLDLSRMKRLESLPEEIGDLENLEELDARYTLISRPPSSIVQLNKLKVLNFAKHESEGRSVDFVFPPLNEGLLSLEQLNLSYCNLTDGALPEDIGSLSSLKKLNLRGNNFEHFRRSITQLGALESLDLSNCKKLTQLPKFPQQLYKMNADWSSDSICNSLFRNISSLQHDISDSGSFSLRVFTSWRWDGNIPSWFHHKGGIRESVSVKLCENWYASDKFLGFAVCYSGMSIDEITAHLIDDDGMSSMTQKFALSKHPRLGINFFLVPLAGLWDASKANGKTPNDYLCFRLFSTGNQMDYIYGVRLLYKR